jgi:hypothetical protein
VSNWIYFESGFAYAKKINVIPVGLGIDISILKPPLNMLQGFNVTSHESLNNFITVINDCFSYGFLEQFVEDDYNALVTNITENALQFEWQYTFNSIEYNIYNKLDEENKYVHRLRTCIQPLKMI